MRTLNWLATTGLALVLCTGPALGQTSGQPQETVPATDPTADPAPVPGTDVVVTGSRLATSLDRSVAPVIAVSPEQLAIAGTDNIADALTDLGPVATGLSENNSQNFYAQAGINLVDLRKLGFERTLVLINGRRVVPGDISSNAVDLNVIPVPLVKRVEIVTGGSSAVYGADAVAGVINVLLRDDFEGLEARARTGITSRGDGAQYGLTLTGGANFAEGRGNLTISALYDKVEGVKATARDYASDNLYNITNPAIAIQGQTRGPGVPLNVQVPNITYLGANQLGLIDLVPFGVPVAQGRFVVNPGGGSVRPYDYGVLGRDIAGVQIGGDGGDFQKYDNLSLPVERYGLTANLNYRLTEGVRFFLEARYIDTRTSTRWQPVADFEYGTVQVSTANPYMPANLRAIAGALGTPVLPFARIYEDFGRRGADNKRVSQQYTAGLDGDLGRFKWNVFAGYGETSLNTRLVGGRDQDRFLQSIDVVTLNGAPACASAAARAAGCQPLNIFNPAATPAGIAYSSVDDNYAASQELRMAGASISGSLFDLPAGPVGAVLGVEWRENEVDVQPSAATRACRIQLLCTQPFSGEVGVKEAFAELRVPILADRPFFHELSLQGAARVSDYTTTGTDWTWNVGGTFAPVRDIRFRVARSRAVRSPTPGSLFSSRSQTFIQLADPCSQQNLGAGSSFRQANCTTLGRPANFVADSSSRATFTGGNPNLDVERGDTLTAGVILTPSFIPGLRISADFFDIELKDAIASVPAQTILNNCYDAPGDPNANSACAAITRNANFSIASVASGFLNIGLLETRGFDFAVSYTRPLGLFTGEDRIALDVSGTYIDKLRYLTNASDPRSEVVLEGNAAAPPGSLGGVPKLEFLASATYSTGKLDVSWRTRFIDSVFVSTQYLAVDGQPQNLWDRPFSGTETFHDLSIAYDVTQKSNVRLVVSNIFDNKPPRRTLFSQGRDRGAIYPNLGTTFSLVLTGAF